MLNATTKKMNKFSSNKNFEILNQANTNRMCEIYLRKTKGEYHCLLLGKNGEALSGQKVQIKIQHRIPANNYSNELTTD